MNDDDDLLVLRACDSVGRFIEYWGFKAVEGRIWTYLTLRGQPVRQIEISSALGLSRAGVSITLAALHKRGLVRRSSPAKRSPWESQTAVWPVITEILRKREGAILSDAQGALRGALAAIEQRPGKYNPERLRELLTMTEMMHALLRLLLGLEGESALGSLRSLLTSPARRLFERLPLRRR
jgi:DNA-binding transcriptional regulator GbsR (MarR family)